MDLLVVGVICVFVFIVIIYVEGATLLPSSLVDVLGELAPLPGLRPFLSSTWSPFPLPAILIRIGVTQYIYLQQIIVQPYLS